MDCTNKSLSYESIIKCDGDNFYFTIKRIKDEKIFRMIFNHKTSKFYIGDTCEFPVNIENIIRVTQNDFLDNEHFWSHRKTKKAINSHIHPFLIKCLNSFHPNLYKFIRRSKEITGKYISDYYSNLLSLHDIVDRFSIILNDKYLFSDYLKYPLYTYLIIKNPYTIDSSKIYNHNWINYIDNKFKSKLKIYWVKKILSKKYSICLAKYLNRITLYFNRNLITNSTNRIFTKTPQSFKELIVQIYASMYGYNFAPSIKEIHKLIPEIKSLRRYRLIESWIEHLFNVENIDVDCTFKQFIDHSRRYHNQIINNTNKTKYKDNVKWDSRLELVSTDGEIEIKPLLDAKSLREESKIMKHCVGRDEYIHKCLQNVCRIFHLQKGENQATMEVGFNESKPVILQVKEMDNKEGSFYNKIMKLYNQKKLYFKERVSQ